MADLVAFLTAYRYYLTEVGQSGNPVAGRAVFDAKGCRSCHATSGATTFDKPGPRLDRYRGQYLRDPSGTGDVEPRPRDGRA